VRGLVQRQAREFWQCEPLKQLPSAGPAICLTCVEMFIAVLDWRSYIGGWNVTSRSPDSLLTLLASGPPLWSNGQSSWLQAQRFRVRFSLLPDFLSSMGLERCPLGLVRINEELLERKSSGSGLEN
jgi:hypothetical protein